MQLDHLRHTADTSFPSRFPHWLLWQCASYILSFAVRGLSPVLLFCRFFQRGPTSLATSDSALSCICAFFVSFLSKLMSSTYPRSPTYFSGILLDLGVRVMKPSPSISAFLISQSMTTIKKYNTERSPSNTSVFTSSFSVTVPSITTAERVPF